MLHFCENCQASRYLEEGGFVADYFYEVGE